MSDSGPAVQVKVMESMGSIWPICWRCGASGPGASMAAALGSAAPSEAAEVDGADEAGVEGPEELDEDDQRR